MATAALLILNGAEARTKAKHWIDIAPVNTRVSFAKARRSLDQNSRLHALLTDVAQQTEWAGARRDVEAWKDIFTAALRSANHGLDVVPGINGGFVLLGMHTSSMTKEEVTDLMALIEAFGAERGVVWSEPAKDVAA